MDSSYQTAARPHAQPCPAALVARWIVAQLQTSPCTWGAPRIHPTVAAQSSPKLLLIFSNPPFSNPPTHASPLPTPPPRPLPPILALSGSVLCGQCPASHILVSSLSHPPTPTSGLVTGPPVHANTRRSSNVFHMIALDKTLFC